MTARLEQLTPDGEGDWMDRLEVDAADARSLLALAEIHRSRGCPFQAEALLRRARASDRLDDALLAWARDLESELEEGPPVFPLSVIIVAEEGGPWLGRAVDALHAQRDLPAALDIVVVDVAPHAPAARTLESLAVTDDIRVLRGPGATVGAARNRGVGAAKGELVLFLDEGAIPGPHLVRRHFDAHLSDWRRTAVLGTFPPTRAVQRMEAATDVLRGLCHDPWSLMIPGAIHDWTSFWCCNLSIPRYALREVGGFDEALHEPVLVDLEAGYRLMGAGFGTLFEPEATCAFDEAPAFMPWLRSTLEASHDHRHLLDTHGSSLVHEMTSHPVTNADDIDRLQDAIDFWEHRPTSEHPAAHRALLMNLEGALRNVHWPHRRIEMPHLVNRIYKVLGEIFDEEGERERAQTCRRHVAV